MGTTTSSPAREQAGVNQSTSSSARGKAGTARKEPEGQLTGLTGDEDSTHIPIGMVKDADVGPIGNQANAVEKARRYVEHNPGWEWNGQWTNYGNRGVIGVRRVARRLEEGPRERAASISQQGPRQRAASSPGNVSGATHTQPTPSEDKGDSDSAWDSRHRGRASKADFMGLFDQKSSSARADSTNGTIDGPVNRVDLEDTIYRLRHTDPRHTDPLSASEESPSANRVWYDLGGGTFKRVTILDNMNMKHAPRTTKECGVRLSIPSRKNQGKIGPITVEETTEVVDCNGNDDSAFVLMQVVHCLPAARHFKEPLTLDFVVRDAHVRWWNKVAVRKEVLREYQILTRQDETDCWQEMDPKDVSVAWDEEGLTCLRAQIKHFSEYAAAKRTKKTSAVSVTRRWDESVLVVNSTTCAAHVTQMPVSFDASQETMKACSLTFCETIGVSFEAGKKMERLMLPVNKPSEIIPAGGDTPLFLSGGAKEMSIIICFLPDRKPPVSSAEAASPCPGTSPATGATSPSPVRAVSHSPTRSQQGTRNRWSIGAVVRALQPNWLISETAMAQPGAEENPPKETEKMVYCMTKILPGRRKLTLLQPCVDGVSVNNTITIEKSDCALETYAMRLANFGDPIP